ncbi:hypothetical protein BU25DRAFT_423967 [Macroventuria anomochaeta]|uniref:Uncharacterized protein n=1 Tax=Macroventuria anomochaeta TaxID=301207 RepID=A0ACB6RRS5_9PLEO|nr:uncharacterized protein BU25DRAFT_423967 [Macroventuria anomochaeta]KAF2624498.1 hypothetical protein BU25DRAFT_423967 [Macroventuria anomochaeta]
MAPSNLPNTNEFENVNSPEVEKFPNRLPDRPGEKKSYLSTIICNNKSRIIVCLVCFLAMIGGTVAAAMFISQSMESIQQGQAVLSAISSSPTTTATPTPLQSTMTKTTMVTQTSVVTGQITITISGLQSTIYAIATAPPAPAIACHTGDTRVTCGSLASQPE